MAADPLTRTTVDDLLNYDIDSDDPFGENIITNKPRDDKPTLSPRAARRRADADDADSFGLDLGLDAEVKIKKRKPNPKLDEALLLSKPGIPKLRALAKDGISKKLRLKGKGHEFSDAAKLLNYFQLWLDDLYPRAKFADGLEMVEKVGHSKRMQVMRKEWINESKHKDLYDDDMYDGQTNGEAAKETMPDSGIATDGDVRPSVVDDDPHSDDLFFPGVKEQPERTDSGGPDDDELDALLAEHSTAPQPKPRQQILADDFEGEDDLDALLAEAEQPRAVSKYQEDADKDDLDALLAEQAVRQRPVSAAEPETQDENDDLDAMLAEQETRSHVAPTAEVVATDKDQVVLDTLMAE